MAITAQVESKEIKGPRYDMHSLKNNEKDSI